MKFKNKKEAVVLPFPTPGNVVSLTEYRRRSGSPQILTEVVASECDRSTKGVDPNVTGMLVRQVVPIDELSAARDRSHNEPPDDLIA